MVASYIMRLQVCDPKMVEWNIPDDCLFCGFFYERGIKYLILSLIWTWFVQHGSLFDMGFDKSASFQVVA